MQVDGTRTDGGQVAFVKQSTFSDWGKTSNEVGRVGGSQNTYLQTCDIQCMLLTFY